MIAKMKNRVVQMIRSCNRRRMMEGYTGVPRPITVPPNPQYGTVSVCSFHPLPDATARVNDPPLNCLGLPGLLVATSIGTRWKRTFGGPVAVAT